MSYKVKSGDTLSGIAKQFGVSLAELEKANPQIPNPNRIYSGEPLNIPGQTDSFQPAPKPKGNTPSTGKTGGTSQSGSAGPVSNTVGGQVGSWIAQAQTILEQSGIPASKMNARDIATIIQHESGGNPNAENKWDSNWKAGHPSIGLMQTIGPTFDHYKLPGHNDIRNPVDNIIAGVRYAIARYGSISDVPGVVRVNRGLSYVGY
ncbi:MAG: LysM peptidoglycan-binding domain-containing protein [Deltaproteobacteria bacterium]|nr:LysM peptidoglycan-binding domain-containing protein [Deltaproteobacteria bacterium]